MPLFDSQLNQLMTNNIIGRNSHGQTISRNIIHSNPSLLLTKTTRQSSHSQPIFSNTSHNQQSIFDTNKHSAQYQSTTHTIQNNQQSRSDKQRSLLYTHKFIKFSSYFGDQYDINDHNGQFEEVEIGGEIYKFKKPKVSARRRNRYKPLAPVPKRLPVSRTVGDIGDEVSTGVMGESRVQGGFQQVQQSQQSYVSVYNNISNFDGQQSVLQQYSLATSSIVDNNPHEKVSPLPINTATVNQFTPTEYNKLITSQIGDEQKQTQALKLHRQRRIYPNKGIQYEKYCLQTTNSSQLDKYYNRIITYPKLKAKLSPQLQRIKDQLKKKFPAVYANDDTSSSQQQSSQDQGEDEETRKRKKGEREWKKELLRRKRERKDFCEITGERRVEEMHRWGSKEDYEKYIKKKEYEDKVKRINQEKMRKLNIGKKVDKKLQLNKYKDSLIRLAFGTDSFNVDDENSNKVNDSANPHPSVIQLLDDDDRKDGLGEKSCAQEVVVIGVDDDDVDDFQLQRHQESPLEDDNDCVVVVASSKSDHDRKPHAISCNRRTVDKNRTNKAITVIKQTHSNNSKHINLDSEQQQLSPSHFAQQKSICL